MGTLKQFTMSDDITEDGDSLGGSFEILDSGLYVFTVKRAYLIESIGGATGIVLNMVTKDNINYTETIYISSGKARGQKNYYVTKDGTKKYLPGFNMMNNFSLLTVGKPLAELTEEETIVDIYDFQAKATIPTKVQMLTDLINKQIKAGVIKQIVNKKKKHPQTGKYVATAETREENVISKFFRAKDNMTVTEIKAKVDKAVFFEKWAKKNAGKTKDRTEPVDSSVDFTTETAPAQTTLFA